MTVARCTVSALLLGLALSSQTKAKDTGYVFVSNEKTNDVTVIDPRQEDRVIKWIHTSHRPRGMSWQNDRKQLLVACGDDAVIDVIDVATLAVTDHIPTGADPEMFELSQDQKTLYVPNKAGSVVEVISISEKIIERNSNGRRAAGYRHERQREDLVRDLRYQRLG